MSVVIVYIIKEGDKRYLCVMDDAQKTFARHEMDLKALARLAAESSRAVNSGIGGYDAPPYT